ncbi:hypothetical protein L3X38_041682 [Prunus dulcis]|uniref:Uncharacterized protein n=1 Tax=Prunus dulcis TaxID=3755 RepID=A0AAD4UTH9_PRUDU|nr:hypothetical protein L3X38_041682 [Prunus dulcis]
MGEGVVALVLVALMLGLLDLGSVSSFGMGEGAVALVLVALMLGLLGLCSKQHNNPTGFTEIGRRRRRRDGRKSDANQSRLPTILWFSRSENYWFRFGALRGVDRDRSCRMVWPDVAAVWWCNTPTPNLIHYLNYLNEITNLPLG